ncbi:MAG: DUF721 domain-containing protein [Bacteroidetes bacterium]|nr:MAG: DUF721 domain-containing protein [Bacteroidota bacterium]
MHSNDRQLKDVIKELIDTYRLNDGLNEAKIIGSWESVVGKMIANHTEKLRISNGKLFVRLDSPAVKNELMYARGKLLKSLNETVGKDVIKEIIFL